MRPAALVGLVVFVAAARVGAAEPPAYRAVVTDVDVKLRAGPSDSFPETGTLPRGSAVVVEKEESGGWLAVTAPYGSVSWVASSFIEDPAPDRPTPRNVFVSTGDEVTEVTLAAGKAGEPQPLDIRRVKVPSGTVLLLLGPKVKFNERTWYPVAPPAGDVRYLPRTAVQFEKPANNNFTVRVTEPSGPALAATTPPAPAGGPLATVPGPGITPAGGGVTASKPAVNHPLWTKAETAEREGRLVDAEKAYFDLAALMNGSGGDHDIANLCYTRIHAIREKKRNGGATGSASASTGVLQPPAREERGVRPGAPQALPAASKGNTNPPPSAADDANDVRPHWSGPGTLRRSALTPDGKGRPAYALETAPGVVKMYVIAGPGVELDRLVGKRVDVYGAPQTRNGSSKPYTIATAVEPVQ